MTPKYPHVQVQLTGEDGSAPAIIARCRQAAMRAGIPKAERDKFMRTAYSGDYQNVNFTACEWFNCT